MGHNHRVLHPGRRRDHAAVHRRRTGVGERHADGGPVADHVPGRPDPGPQRPARGGAAVLRPLHDPGDLTGGVEHRDPDPAGGAAPAFHGRLRTRKPAARVRHRGAGGDVRAAADGAGGVAPDRLPPGLLDRLARSARQAGVHVDAAGDDRVGDREPGSADQLAVRPAGEPGSAARDRQRVPRVHAAAGHVQRGGGHGAVPHAQPPGGEPRHVVDAQRGGHGHAPDQPAADPGGGVHDRAAHADRAPAVPARRIHPQIDGTGVACAVLVRVQPAVRRAQPAVDTNVIRGSPYVRLLFQRGEFTPKSTELVSLALFWFAFSLPFGGLNLLLTRTFFAVQRPWIPTRLAAMNIVVDIVLSVALYKPLGVAGLIIGTVVANAVMTALQFKRLKVGLNGCLEGAQTTMITARVLVASALLGVASWVVWYLI